MDFREKFNGFVSHPFVKDAAVLQVGNILSMGIGILTAILIARWLQPEKYGLYSLVFAFAGLLSIFMNVGAEKAVVTLFSEAYAEKDEEEIKNILTYFLKINIIIFLLIGVAFIILAPILSNYFYQSIEIGNLTRLIILTNILGLFFAIITIIFQVTRQMANYVVIDVINNIFKGVFSLLFIFWGLGVFGVVFAQLIVAFVMLVVSIFFYQYLASKNNILPSFKKLLLNVWRAPIKKYFKFSFWIAVNDNLSSLYGYLPMIFLGMFAPIQSVGLFKIALKYTSIPLMLLSPISQLLNIQLPVTKTLGYKSLRKNFIKATLYSFLISVILMILLVLMAPFLIKTFYGDSYLPSVNLIYYLAGFSVLFSIGVGVGPIFRALDLMSTILKINFIVILFGLPFVYLAIKTYGIMGAIFFVFGWPLISDIIALSYILNILSKIKSDESYSTA